MDGHSGLSGVRVSCFCTSSGATLIPTANLNEGNNDMCIISGYDSEDTKGSNLACNVSLDCMARFTRVSTWAGFSVQFFLKGCVLRWDRNCG